MHITLSSFSTAPTMSPFLLLLLLSLFAFLSSAFSCSSDEDCSLNGLCSASTQLCHCDAGWRSSDCGELDLSPATRSTGYNHTAEGVSSWGGKIVQDPTNPALFHLFAAEFSGGCTLDDWAPMSRIIRAESHDGPAGPYTFADEVVGTFAHNPSVVWSEADQLYLLYHIGCPYKQPTQCESPSFSCDSGNTINGESGITLRSSADLRKWTTHGQILSANENGTWDQDTTNPSPFPLHSSHAPTSAILLAYRGCPYNCGGAELLNLAIAHNFTSNYHRMHQEPIFVTGNEGVEDPFVWRDKRGHFHILVHSLEPGGAFGDGPKVGRHAFARSLMGKWIFNTATLAFNTTVQMTDGTAMDFFRRERPQLYFSDDGEMTPLYLTNGVQERNTSQTYTLIQPLGPAKVYERQLGLVPSVEHNKHQRMGKMGK